MRIEDVRRHTTTPLTSPAYARTVPRFTDREHLDIVCRPGPGALRAVVPEPPRTDLTPAPVEPVFDHLKESTP